MANVKSERVSPMIITDPDEGREYTLEFNRKSVVKTEQAGLNINALDSMSMTMIPLLFWGAFQMHHPYMTQEKTDEILFDKLGGLNKDELAQLGQLFAVTYQTLIATEDNENPRKLTVKF